MIDHVMEWWGEGVSDEELLYRIRETPEYEQRFPGMKDILEDGRAWTEQQYIQYENRMTEMAHEYGIPREFFSRQRIGQMMVNDVSVNEAQQRMDLALTAVTNAPDYVKQAGRDMYGLEPEDLLPLYLGTDEDDTLPLVQRRAAAIRAYGAGQYQDFDLTTGQAETISEMSTDPEEIERRMARLGQQGNLFRRTAGESSQLSKDTGVEAEFGQNQQAAQKVQDVAAARQAQQRSQSGFSAGRAGVGGLESK
jgi:hypothetical protein